jgi:hypothetical protein
MIKKKKVNKATFENEFEDIDLDKIGPSGMMR